MPMLGLGTSHVGGYNQDTFVYALRDCGYRHIDTAQRYGCESKIGEGIQLSGVARQDIFLTTKLWISYYDTGVALQEFEKSMQKLNTDYLDLFLLHWPADIQDHSNVSSTWRALELLLEQGKVRSIGVSNFQQRHLQRLIDQCSVVPHVNQCEFHPYQNDKGLRLFCEESGVKFTGYSPLGKGMLLNDEHVVRIAREHQKSPSQILIKWSLQNNVVTIPKSTDMNRVKQNAEVWDFELSAKDMEQLNNMHQNLHVTWDPTYVD